MDLRKLRYFAGVVEAKSMSKAANRLHVAQPALSKSLRSLEDDFGAELLRRSPQGVAATEAGLRLMSIVRFCSNRSIGRGLTSCARSNALPDWWRSGCRIV